MNDEWSLEFHIENNDVFPKFTFAELSKQNITSQQLYFWSAPIDVVERYQFYLNQLSTSNDIFLESQKFYNCTLPRFGSMCQYEITYYNQNHSSLYEIIHDYYRTFEYNLTNFTCYTHLQCNRGPFPACLDWSEICDGKVDCLDGEFDEEHCWQLEINECNDNEYRCINGQCISQSFFRDDINIPDCLDGSDENQMIIEQSYKCKTDIPSFACEEKTCLHTFMTSSCVEQRQTLLLKAVYSAKDNSTSEQCWSALKCLLEVPDLEEPLCTEIYDKLPCVEIINNTCPDMFYIPDIPLFFGPIYLAHTKNDSLSLVDTYSMSPYLCYSNSYYDEYSIDCPKILFKNKTCFHPDLYARKNISFQTICDGFTELIPIIIEGQNETDETECGQWSCNNIYTRCDGLWNCPHGEDEVGCDLSSTLNCSLDHHKCVSPYTNELICLPIKQANDGKIDCLGATDEPTLCQKKYQEEFSQNFYCINSYYESCIGVADLCDNYTICDYEDDEKFCVKNRTDIFTYDSICFSPDSSILSDVEQFLCHETKFKIKEQIKYFSLDGMSKPVEDQATDIIKRRFSSSSRIEMSDQHEHRCHRGFDLRIWLNNETNLTTNTCLCPPSFYGNICQYQNQRVSLTITFRVLSDSWSTLFAIIISLIDDSEERIIHSYEQFTYLSIRDCKIKFNIYLLYSARPKNETKNYAIQIDIYEKISLTYRGSLLFPIMFPFLPVHRLAYIVDIPRINENIQTCLNSQCIHGKCMTYSNNPKNNSFCQCNSGWSGRYCTIPYSCMCSSDSICMGVSVYNRSVCVCPINKFGDRCLLVDTICQMDKNLLCQNGGQCIPADEYMISTRKFVCICPKGYIGDLCEIVDNKIILSFHKHIVLSQSIFIHFIDVINNGPPIRTTTFRTISLTKNSLIVYWSQPFHLVFIELLNKIYYLVVIQKTYERSTTINKTINPSDRCQHINELFNETFVQMNILRRIKYYHLPCQNYSSNLSCFYDNLHIYLCYDYGKQRLADCFDFNHNMKFDCFGQSVCENEGQCFQDTPDCPQRSMCICPTCFYGTRRQFSSSGFGLSLDAILGYHIQPHIGLIHQPNIVKTSLALTIIFMVVGFINGVLALITFNNKSICEVGCGLYLLGSSITTLLTTIIFGLKFWILLIAQMTPISNRLFLKIQCISLDFILRVCLNMDQWLNACVATERAVTIIKATHFHKATSKNIAKIVIVILVIFTISTSITDLVYRRLIDEDNEDYKRIWCIVNYPSSLKIFNSIMHTFHFMTPFIINLISAIILITKKSRQRSNLQINRNFKELLKEQIREHKHLFTAPVLLVILALPRLILSFASKCMNSTNDAWLFLIGYFISCIPPMLTFVVFILPSKFYKQQLRKSLVAYRTKIQKQLYYII
ncbi:unnamed protein product [Rotaria sp. Silwood1]|nr:unnamed protein product [Rotaria sp. Silwood1]CAF4756985.1 unnamed protein product [Rotaria sp. Silwood1]